jgi:3,4-dihydroxy-2-butanone 4-phosphate synthase
LKTITNDAFSEVAATGDSVLEAIEAIRNGEMVVVSDDEDRENEGDLIIAAEFADAAAVNFMITKGKGLVCLAITQDRATDLNLAQMVYDSTESMGTAFTVSVDAKPDAGVLTGISAGERAITIRKVISGVATDLVTPGHMFPLVAKSGGVLERPGHTEAAVDLARMAGCYPAGVIVEIIGDDGEMLRGEQLSQFAIEHGLKRITIHDLVMFRSYQEVGYVA